MTHSPYSMLSVEEALAIVLENTPRLSVTDVDLADAGGRVLPEDVLARESLPPYAASVKDGCAVVASDGPGEYPVIGEVRAGIVSDFTVTPGTVAYITTGAPMPDGADAVFGLPGNPMSSLVTFYLFAAPAIRKMAGRLRPEPARMQAHLAQPVALDSERPEYHRATLKWDRSLSDRRGGYVATSTGSQASSRLLSMRTASALLVLPAGDGELAPGAVVDALLIGDRPYRE